MDIMKNKYMLDRAGKDYRPKEESPRHVFFFKGHYIMISEDYRDVWVLTRNSYFSTHNKSVSIFNNVDNHGVRVRKINEIQDVIYNFMYE